MIRLFAGIIMGFALLPWASAAEPDPEVEAERLFQAGNRAARRQRWADALRDWSRAEDLRPTWQPAFNQSTVLVFIGKPLEGWMACQRALEREIPEDRRPKVEAECEAIERKLLGTHAELRLTVEPADATVELDGRSWHPPRRTFVPRAESVVRVASAGFAEQKLRWRHPIGQRHNQTVKLVPLPPPPAPPTEPPEAPASAPPVAAAAPKSSPPPPELWAAPPTVPELVGGPDPLWKWVAWSAGAAAGVGGGWLLADAEDLRTPRIFRQDYAQAESAFESRQWTGVGLLGAAGLGLAAGFTLWWLEEP